MDVKKIEAYLNKHGAIIQDKTNEYEVIRFTVNDVVCVVYQGKKGISFSSATARDVYEKFRKGLPLKTCNYKRKQKPNFKKMLIDRDGLSCFYTGKQMGADDCTIEHLIPLSKGGTDNLHNMVLCEKSINHEMADLPLVCKLRKRDQMRRVYIQKQGLATQTQKECLTRFREMINPSASHEKWQQGKAWNED